MKPNQSLLNTVAHNYDEAELLKRFQKGDAQAFEAIFKTYWYPLFKIANARMRAPEDAEEIVQDIFTGLWKNREEIFITNLPFYLFASVRKRCLNKVRSRLVQEKYRNYYLTIFTDSSLATDEAVGLSELTEVIDKALLDLPEKSQQIFRLNRINGLSVPEISSILNTPQRTIEYHLSKAVRRLRIHLKDFIAAFIFFLSGY